MGFFRKDKKTSEETPQDDTKTSSKTSKAEFKIVKHENQRPEGYGTCPGDCEKCSRCIIGLNTVVVLH